MIMTGEIAALSINPAQSEERINTSWLIDHSRPLAKALTEFELFRGTPVVAEKPQEDTLLFALGRDVSFKKDKAVLELDEGDSFLVRLQGEALSEVGYFSRTSPDKYYCLNIEGDEVSFAVRKYNGQAWGDPQAISIDQLDRTAARKIANFGYLVDNRIRFCQTRRKLVIGLAGAAGAAGLGWILSKFIPEKPSAIQAPPVIETVNPPGQGYGGGGIYREREEHVLEKPTRPVKDRTVLIAEVQEEIAGLAKEMPGQSAFFAQNEKGEVIAVNSEVPFEAWSLITLPIAMLALRDIRQNPAKYNLTNPVVFMGHTYPNFREAIFRLLRNHDEYVYEGLVYQLTGTRNWDASCKIIAKRLQTELELTKTDYSVSHQLFMTTAGDLGKILGNIINRRLLQDEDRDFIIQALAEQTDNKTRLAYFKTQYPVPSSISSFHIIGEGEFKVGMNHHDMGGFIKPDGSYSIFVCLNQQAVGDIESFNQFETQALTKVLGVL